MTFCYKILWVKVNVTLQSHNEPINQSTNTSDICLLEGKIGHDSNNDLTV